MSTFKFKPKYDADYTGSPLHTNGARAKRAAVAVVSYCAECKYKTRKFDQSTVQDLITDLCHLMDREKFDVDESIRMALNNWRVER